MTTEFHKSPDRGLVTNPQSTADLPGRLRELIVHAEHAGAPAAWLAETSRALVEALIELEALRAAVPESRLQALADAHALRQLVEERKAAGDTGAVASAARALGISRSCAYKRLSTISWTDSAGRTLAPVGSSQLTEVLQRWPAPPPLESSKP
jgi:hypothetical protein